MVIAQVLLQVLVVMAAVVLGVKEVGLIQLQNKLLQELLI